MASLGEISASLSLELNKFESNISKAIASLKKLDDNTKQTSQSMDKSVNVATGNIAKGYNLWEKTSGKTANANVKHAKKVEMLTKQMGLLDTAIGKGESELSKIEKKYGSTSTQAEEYRSKLLDLKMSHATLGEELVKTNKESGTLKNKFKDLGVECEKIDEKFSVFDKTGDKLMSFGGKMTASVTLPVVGAGIAAGKMAMDFQTGVQKITTVADMSKISVDNITSSIIDMSNKTGISTSELNEALYQTISAGVDTAHSVEFLSDATKLAEAGFAEINPTIDALTSILNAYGLEASETARISDVLIQSQNLGKLSVGELSGAIGRVIPTANAANVSIEQLSAGYVEMTKNGVSVNESTTLELYRVA